MRRRKRRRSKKRRGKRKKRRYAGLKLRKLIHILMQSSHANIFLQVFGVARLVWSRLLVTCTVQVFHSLSYMVKLHTQAR